MTHWQTDGYFLFFSRPEGPDSHFILLPEPTFRLNHLGNRQYMNVLTAGAIYANIS